MKFIWIIYVLFLLASCDRNERQENNYRTNPPMNIIEFQRFHPFHPYHPFESFNFDFEMTQELKNRLVSKNRSLENQETIWGSGPYPLGPTLYFRQRRFEALRRGIPTWGVSYYNTDWISVLENLWSMKQQGLISEIDYMWELSALMDMVRENQKTIDTLRNIFPDINFMPLERAVRRRELEFRRNKGIISKDEYQYELGKIFE